MRPVSKKTNPMSKSTEQTNESTLNGAPEAAAVMPASRPLVAERKLPDGSEGDRSEEITEPAVAAPTKILDPRPKIQMAGDGRLISQVATELGQILAPAGIYCYAEEAAIYDRRTKTLYAVKPAKFRTWVEEHIIPIKLKETG